ncbi:MAG TPA: gamma-glutamyltransferase [Chloroflexota bacterium]|nr:gamma-glutamyltransferase [Chloroflexota bacterium]
MSLGPHGIRGEAHRTVVAGMSSMICSGHPLASQAGQAVLQRGGNAIDGALAVAAALGVVEPNMSGLGGDGFIMVRDGASGRIRVMNATGPAPARATREAYLPDGIPMKGIRSVSVPGLVAGWLRAHAAGGRLSVAACFAPAVELAARGFPISLKLAASIASDPALAEFPSSRAIFTRDGRPLQTGEILVQRDLANSLGRLAEEGEAAFYNGFIAHAIAATSAAYNGLLTADDLAAYAPAWQEPISVDYRGYTVYEAPPNSSGHVLLQMLNLAEGLDLADLEPNSAEAVHLMVEAKKLAFADREAYLADPNYVEIPLEGLLAKDYARERARLIDPRRAAETVSAGRPTRIPEAREDTTCFVVVDGEGNAVCQLQSIQSGFGSGLVAEGTGILLNNRMTYWHLEPDHVDCLAPGKRVRHTMNPVMITRGNDLILVCGTPGADTQVQTNLQVITHVLDHGYSVVEAVEAPRWRHLQDGTESTIPHNCQDELLLERRFVPAVVDELRRRGQPVRLIGDWEAMGSEVMIQLDPATGARFGAADPRRDGYAIGW